MDDPAPRADLLKPPPAHGAAAAAHDPSGPRLAYSYSDTLSLPADDIEAALDHDQRACMAAGAAVCELVGSSLSRHGSDTGAGHLELRATPAWIASFRSGLANEAKAAGGEIKSAQLQSEDLTRNLVDTEAAIRAKTVLRDRIQQLVATRPGGLSEVMDAEKELAAVQTDLDATQSEYAVMRARVDMSTLTIDYQADGLAAPDNPFRPLTAAARAFLGNVVRVFAVLLSLLSFVLPLALVAGPVAVGFYWVSGKYSRRITGGGGVSPPPRSEGP
jgi:hypothetical protein